MKGKKTKRGGRKSESDEDVRKKKIKNKGMAERKKTNKRNGRSGEDGDKE